MTSDDPLEQTRHRWNALAAAGVAYARPPARREV